MSNQEKEALLAEIHNLKLEKDDLAYKLEYLKQSRQEEKLQRLLVLKKLKDALAEVKRLKSELKNK